MDKRARAQQLLAELGQTLKIESLRLDDSTDSCGLVFDGELPLDIEYEKDTGRVVLRSPLGELPEDNAEPLLRELLVADLFWHRTKGATLGLEAHSRRVMLTQAKSVVGLDRREFEMLVETFLNQADKWRWRIAAKGSESADGAAVSTALGNRSGPVIFG